MCRVGTAYARYFSAAWREGCRGHEVVGCFCFVGAAAIIALYRRRSSRAPLARIVGQALRDLASRPWRSACFPWLYTSQATPTTSSGSSHAVAVVGAAPRDVVFDETCTLSTPTLLGPAPGSSIYAPGLVLLPEGRRHGARRSSRSATCRCCGRPRSQRFFQASSCSPSCGTTASLAPAAADRRPALPAWLLRHRPGSCLHDHVAPFMALTITIALHELSGAGCAGSGHEPLRGRRSDHRALVVQMSKPRSGSSGAIPGSPQSWLAPYWPWPSPSSRSPCCCWSCGRGPAAWGATSPGSRGNDHGCLLAFLPILVDLGISVTHYYRLMWFRDWI